MRPRVRRASPSGSRRLPPRAPPPEQRAEPRRLGADRFGVALRSRAARPRRRATRDYRLTRAQVDDPLESRVVQLGHARRHSSGQVIEDAVRPVVYLPERLSAVVIVVAVIVSISVSIPMVIVDQPPAIAFPITLVEAPAIVMGHHPHGTGIWWSGPISVVPLPMMTHRIPIALHPDKARSRSHRSDR